MKLTTSMGPIVIELDKEKAPISTENFVKYVDVGPLQRHDLPPRDRRLHGPGRRLHQGHAQKPTRAPIKNESTNGLKNDDVHGRHGAHQRARLGHVAVLHQREATTTSSTSRGRHEPRATRCSARWSRARRWWTRSRRSPRATTGGIRERAAGTGRHREGRVRLAGRAAK